MWLSLFIALLTYLLAPKNTSAERSRALLAAAGAGAITYGVQNYTDWGKENLAPLDTKIGNLIAPPKDQTVTGATVATPVAGSGWWDKLKDWAVPAVGALGAASVATSIPTWAWLVGAGLLGVWLLKD